MSHRNGHHDRSNRFEDSEPVRPRRKGEPPAGNGKSGAPSDGKPEQSHTSASPRSLSEISHLFLSDLRSASGHGRQPPKRIPPGAQKQDEASAPPSGELTAEDLDAEEPGGFSVPPVSAVIGARLGGTLLERASQYASSLADELPVGLLIIEQDSVRLVTVAQGEDDNEPASAEVLDDISLRAALMEMSCDIARWLVVLPDPRLPQARRLLAGIREWVLLVPADHEGVVSGYRVLKGLCDLELPTDTADAPRVTLAFVDAADAKEAKRHARRLVGVCKQFLDLDVETADVDGGPSAGAVSNIGAFMVSEVGIAPWVQGADSPVARVLEQVLIIHAAGAPLAGHDSDLDMVDELLAASTGARTPAAKTPQIAIPPIARPVAASGFFADDWVSANEDLSRLERRPEPRQSPEPSPMAPSRRKHVLDLEIPELALPLSRVAATTPAALEPANEPQVVQAPAGPPATQSAPVSAQIPASAQYVGPRIMGLPVEAAAHAAVPATDFARVAAPSDTPPVTQIDDVIDLPAGRSVAAAVSLRLSLAETPIAPPMLAGSSLCISRDGGFVLVAAAAPGLEDLPTIGRALTWASENRVLLRMALTQYRVDESREVRLHLLVSCADVNADALRPLMSTGRVTVQAYRRLSWGGRSGLLLEAA